MAGTPSRTQHATLNLKDGQKKICVEFFGFFFFLDFVYTHDVRTYSDNK